MLFENSGIPTGQAVQRRLHPLTTSIQYSIGFFGTTAGGSLMPIKSLSLCLTDTGIACLSDEVIAM